MARLPLQQKVLRQLFAHSGNQCAFPDCDERIIDSDGDCIGQICHIEAAEKGGERFNDDSDDEVRRSFGNLILLCYKHHKKTNNTAIYSVDALKKMKQDHEAQYADKQYQLPAEIEEKVFRELADQIERIERTVNETKGKVEQGNKVAENTYDKTVEILAMLKASATSGTIPIDDKKIYSEQLKFIKQFKEDGKVVTAMQTLIKFKDENWGKIDDELRFKVIANIASALFDQGRKDDAATYLNELEKLENKTEDCLVYLALGYAIQNRKEDFDAIIQTPGIKDSVNATLWVAYMHMQGRSKTPEELRDAVPAGALKKSEVLFTLGEAFIDAGNNEVGLRMMEESITAEGGSESKRWQVQAITTTQRLTTIATQEKVSFRNFNKKELDQIQICISELTEIWKHISQTELGPAWWHVLMNRGIAYKVMGDKINAEKDMEGAWYLAKNFASLKNLVCEYFDTDQIDKALRLLDSTDVEKVKGYNIVDYISLKARCYYLKKQPDTAAAMISEKLEEVEGEDRNHLLDLIVVGYFEQGAFAKALPFAERQIQEFPDIAFGYLSKATCMRLMDDPDSAIENLQLALSKAKGTKVRAYVWYQIAAEFYDLGLYDECIESLEKIYHPEYVNPTTRKIVLANYHAGHLDRAEELCKQAKTVKPGGPLINEVLFRIYEQTGRGPEAEALLNEYLAAGDGETLDHFRLLGINYYRQAEKKEKLQELLLQIQNPREYTLMQRFAVATMHLECGEIIRGLQIAYDARIENFENVQAHQFYVNFAIKKPEEPKELMYPDVVAADMAVELVNKAGKPSKYFITDDPRAVGNDVLRTSDPLAQMLLNKKFGDEVTMDNSVGVGNVLKINSIMSRNVHAFRESLKLLETKFAGQSGMFFFTGEQEAPLDILNDFMIKRAQEHDKKRDEILRMYNAGSLTIGMLANTFGRNIVEMWFEMMMDNKTAIRCYEKNESLDIEVAQSQKLPVVVDSFSLFTIIALIEREDLFRVLEGDYYVAQAVYNEIKEYRTSLDGPRPEMSVTVHQGQVIDTTVSQEDIESQKVWLDRVLHWCTYVAKVQAPKSRIMVKGWEKLENMLGSESFETMKLASELKGMILSEDAMIKTLALQIFGVGSFSSYQIITQSARDTQITSEEFSKYTKALAQSNYLYIPITGEDLWDMYDTSEFRIQPPFTRALRGLRLLNPEFAARAMSTFAKKIYLNISLPESRDQVLQAALRMLKQRGDFEIVKAGLRFQAERDFGLMPQQKEDFKQLIDAI